MSIVKTTRRCFIKSSSLALTGIAVGACGQKIELSPNITKYKELAEDDLRWKEIASFYDVNPDIINVENGNWGIMAKPVLEAYLKNTEKINKFNSYFSRREFGSAYNLIKERLAIKLGAKTEEIALTRGATEALQNIIGGFNALKKGDILMIADIDYGSIKAAMQTLARQNYCSVVELSIPEPVDYNTIIEFYRIAFIKNPKTKLLLLTHISHRSGLVLPVREICQLAKQHNIYTVVDAAHAWGQINYKVNDLDADFIGFNLHKWMGCPLGLGIMYIKKENINLINPNISEAWDSEKVQHRVHSGTVNYAAVLSIPSALDFHDKIGGTAKQERLKFLRNIWVKPCLEHKSIQILTPEDSRLYAGITSFRIRDCNSIKENQQIANYLLKKHKLFTVHRSGLAAGACVRITPSLYNSVQDMEKTKCAVLDAAKYFNR
ncbi:MAG: aminotransferase class V-fold PLP-dependent enzyme [Tenacibaculum sp.]